MKRRGNGQQVFENITPRKGCILFQRNTINEHKTKIEEFRCAKWILENYGGNIVILSESKRKGMSTPDLLRNQKEYIEVKCPSSLTALSSRIKDGIIQLRFEKCGISGKKILILNGKNFFLKYSIKTVQNAIKERLSKMSRIELF